MREALTSVRSSWHKQIRTAVVKAVNALVAYSFTSSAQALRVRLCDVEDARDLVSNVTQLLEVLQTTDEVVKPIVYCYPHPSSSPLAHHCRWFETRMAPLVVLQPVCSLF